jgi:hypothetical protein
MLQTEFNFTLPCGYVDTQGNLHREGTMRRATALDEVAPLQDVRVQRNEAYLSILLLSRVITRLGSVNQISPNLIESLFATDFVYLQELYVQVNETGSSLIATQCPTCGTRFALDFAATNEER